MSKINNGEFKTTTKEVLKDMNTRLSRVEKQMWILIGALGVLGLTKLPEIASVVFAAN